MRETLLKVVGIIAQGFLVQRNLARGIGKVIRKIVHRVPLRPHRHGAECLQRLIHGFADHHMGNVQGIGEGLGKGREKVVPCHRRRTCHNHFQGGFGVFAFGNFLF